MADLARNALIVGCGYLGRVLAGKLLQQGVEVFGTTRSRERAEALAGIGLRPLMVEVTRPVTYASLRPAVEAEALNVFYLVPPGRPDGVPSARQTILGGIAHMVKQLRHARVRRAVLASSTAVYTQTGGVQVDADTPAQAHPDSDTSPAEGPLDAAPGGRARLLLEGERLWLSAGEDYRVVRFAGIYGPGRVIGLKAVKEGAPLLGDPNGLLNLIHVDDAAELLIAVATANEAAPVEVGSDGNPVPRGAYYAGLAERLGVAPPRIMEPAIAAATLGVDAGRLMRASSKAVDNLVTCRRTGWAPQYRDWRAGLDAIL